MKKMYVFILPLLLCCLCAANAEGEIWTGLTADEVVARMGFGWNLGNTLDATGGNREDLYSQEQSWGNAKVEKELIDRVKAAGFDTLRLPVTWSIHTDDTAPYAIDADFLARVREIVDYAYQNDMVVILNLHHEDWLNTPTLSTDYAEKAERLAAMWRQIADYFAAYDQHLIFEGINEPRMRGSSLEWNGNTEGYEAVNYLNAVFVNTVRRDAKGHNGERCLMIPGYAASSSARVMEAIAIPNAAGERTENIIISVHAYTPYNFCLSDQQKDFDLENGAHTGAIDTVFADVKRLFLDKGIPVVIGETSATNKNNTAARENWAYYMGQKAAEYGVPLVLWDNGYNGNSGGECHAWIRRKVNPKLRSQATSVVYPTVLEKLFAGRDSVTWGQKRESAAKVQTDALWQNAAGLTSQKQWDSSYIQLSAQADWFTDGRKIQIAYTGAGEPKIILDSAEKQVWWIPVDPAEIRASGERKVAIFPAEALMKAAKEAGVTGAEQLRNLSVLAANGNITTYEVCVSGKAAQTVTYRCMGRIVARQQGLPAEPAFPHMTFAGWYTTLDCRPGTEYTGEEEVSGGTVYAKMVLDAEAAR